MNSCDELVELILDEMKKRGLAGSDGKIPVGVSNRHIHLSAEDKETLFGAGYQLTPIKDLTQPGQFACKEYILVAGSKGSIEKVRILGPERKETQVEILAGDCFKLGINAPLRDSGKLEDSPGVTLIGPKGSVILKRGVIIAKRHIHMTLGDANRLGVRDGESVTVSVSGIRGGSLSEVLIRAQENARLDFHLDTEEANALGVTGDSLVTIVK